MNTLFQLILIICLTDWSGWTMIGAIGTLIAAFATVAYTIFTYRLLAATKKSIDIANENKDKANKLAEFQIYSKISDDLSSEKALQLFDIIERNLFEIKEIDETIFGESLNPDREIISGRDLLSYILGPIEDLAKFKDDQILSMQSIDSGFGNKILMLGNNEKIVKYIKYLRTKVHFTDNIHGGFESLYEEELKCCTEDERTKYKNHFKNISD